MSIAIVETFGRPSEEYPRKLLPPREHHILGYYHTEEEARAALDRLMEDPKNRISGIRFSLVTSTRR